MKFEKIPTLAFFLILPVLLSLGFWQLHRAEEKQALLELEQRSGAEQPFQLTGQTGDDLTDLKFKSIWAEGQYDVKRQILLDNQIKDGKAGYYVLTPFILKNATKAVLINRGWIPLGASRAKLPDVNVGQNQSVVNGRINSFPSVGIKLAGADKPSPGWPSVVQIADHRILSEALGYPLFSFLIELDSRSPEGYRRDWQAHRIMSPQQHTAYAIQWFGLAIALTMLFIWYSRIR